MDNKTTVGFLDKASFEAICNDREVRRAIARESHLMFFHIMFPHYVKYPLAEFQKDIFRITEDQSNKLACIISFRGSAKSTLVTFSYSLWATLGVQQKKFVLIICQTQAQARQQMANIKYEVENNPLLKSDMGPFREDQTVGDWAISSLVFQNTGARIMIASVDQSIRGIRHRQYRPDLLILDDIEDMSSSKTMEGRTKLYEWFTREIVPLGDTGTRTIMVGNLLHEDSLVMKLRRMIDKNELKGIYRWFPLLDESGKSLWPGKFDSPDKIDELRQSVANELAWRQEYLLEIVSDSTRAIHPEWIHYYDQLPDMYDPKSEYIGTYSGVDLAISQAASADYTAVVSVRVFGNRPERRKYYVLPNPVNEKLPYPRLRERLKEVSVRVGNGSKTTLYIEKVAFQGAVPDDLREGGFNAIGVPVVGDKRERLCLMSPKIENGDVLFPRKGCELLITQLVYFGAERHDDLSDALVLVISELDKNKPHDPDAFWRLNAHLHEPDPNSIFNMRF